MTLLENIFTAIIAGIMFILVSAPLTYKITTGSNCPTALGHVLHAVVFLVLTSIIAFSSNLFKNKYNKKSIKDIFICILIVTLAYYLFSNDEIYSITNKLPFIQTIDGSGCPTYVGIGLHSVIYMIVIFMYSFFLK